MADRAGAPAAARTNPRACQCVGSTRVRHRSVERPRQLDRGRLRRHEDERGRRRVWIERASEIDEDVRDTRPDLERAKEPGVTRGIHLRAGGSMAAS